MSKALPFLSPVALSLSCVLLACGGSSPPAATPADTAPATAATQAAPTSANAAKKPESDKVTWKKDAAAKNCHTGGKGAADLTMAVTGRAP